MLKVVVIEPSGLLYGSEYCLLDILDGLSDRGVSWDVILPQGGGFDELLKKRRISCQFILPRFLHRTPSFRKVIPYLRLYLHLRHTAPDVVYVNQAGMLRIVSVAARQLNLPVVCQVQTLEDAKLVSSRPGLHANVQAFICNSQFIARQTNVDEKQKCTLYQGISQESGTSVRRSVSIMGKSSVRIGILGRIAHSKGHYLLLNAAKSVIEKRPDARFVVIGTGLTKRDTELFSQAVLNANLSDYFEMRGYRSDLNEELRRLDLLTIPSLAEPLGRVLFDAARYEVPVVASNAGGLGEICQHFGVAELFESGNPVALAQCILDSLQNLPKVMNDFEAASSTMLKRLRMSSYLSCIQEILTAASLRTMCNVSWLGDAE